ncbi:FtsB family cell division protein [Massiliimalia massiliensis]|jgi:cell division protein FtsL|uniref:FtsB family cell division protein n=1 Tax=Massiliimalia massiliensis TaxID=1852384 RepID=UPI000985B5E5|nr:septum formation initiator family protein [Massiliimalia massiliensis]
MASKSKARGLKGIIVAVALLVFTIYVVISLILIGNDIKAKRQETVELQAQIVDKETINKELQDLIDNGADAEYIIKIAKEKLGLVYPDERVYVDISGN